MNKLLPFNTCDCHTCTKLANLSRPPNLRTQVLKKIEKYFESSKSQIKRLAGNGKSTNEERWGVSLKITMEVVHLSLGLYIFTYNIQATFACSPLASSHHSDGFKGDPRDPGSPTMFMCLAMCGDMCVPLSHF